MRSTPIRARLILLLSEPSRSKWAQRRRLWLRRLLSRCEARSSSVVHEHRRRRLIHRRLIHWRHYLCPRFRRHRPHRPQAAAMAGAMLMKLCGWRSVCGTAWRAPRASRARSRCRRRPRLSRLPLQPRPRRGRRSRRALTAPAAAPRSSQRCRCSRRRERATTRDGMPTFAACTTRTSPPPSARST